MKLLARQAIDSLNKKFTSGNDIPVMEARITRDEYEALTKVVVYPEAPPPLVEWKAFRRDGCGKILYIYACPLCNEDVGNYVEENNYYNYCPNCGLKLKQQALKGEGG